MRHLITFLSLSLIVIAGCSSPTMPPSGDAGPIVADGGPSLGDAGNADGGPPACAVTFSDFESAALAAGCSAGYIHNAWTCPWPSGTATQAQIDACAAELHAQTSCAEVGSALFRCRGL